MRPQAHRRAEAVEAALLFFLVSLVCLRAGYLSAERWQVHWEGLAAVAHAHDVWHRHSEPRLSEIGFVQPPLPSLLASLVALRPADAADVRYAPAYLGALALGLTAVVFLLLCRALGVQRLWSWLLTGALVFHPVPFSHAAAGSPAALLLPMLLGLAWGLDRWAATGALRPLLVGSLLLGVAVLTRYEMVLWALLTAGAVALVAARRGGCRQAEGTLLAFLLPAGYLAAGWIAACWLIQGDPWYFWRHTFAETPQAPRDAFLLDAIYLSLLCCPFLPAGLYAALTGPTARRATGSLVLIIGSLALVGIGAPLLRRLSGDAWSQLTVPLVATMAAGYLLFARVLPPVQNETERRRRSLALGLAAVGLAAVSYVDWRGAGLPRGPLETLQGHLAFTDDCRAEAGAAVQLSRELQPGERAVIAGWPGFAVALFEGELSRLTLVPTAEPPAAVLPPFEVLLVREPAEGSLLMAWQNRLPAGLELRQRWRVDAWTCYRRVPRR